MAENTWNREKRPENLAEKGPSSGQVTEAATIGASVVIRGDVSGHEPLFIDGTVEGSINFLEHRVTVGRSSRIRADIRAREVVVMGSGGRKHLLFGSAGCSGGWVDQGTHDYRAHQD